MGITHTRDRRNIMKVFVIIQQDTGKVVAVSESKKDTVNYMLSKGFKETEYFFTKIKNSATANELLINFDDLYLEHDEMLDMVLTRVELQMIHDIISEERGMLKSTIHDLEHYLKNYSFSKKEKSILLKAHKILESSTKKKKLRKIIDLDNFIGFITKSKNIADVFRDKLHETKEKMFLFINLKD
jgi:hypothetical protein